MSILQGEAIHLIKNKKNDNYLDYFQAFKLDEDDGVELSLGVYTSGEGIFDSDPMLFEGGDSVKCGNNEDRSVNAYWYCWHTAFPVPAVSLDEM